MPGLTKKTISAMCNTCGKETVYNQSDGDVVILKESRDCVICGKTTMHTVKVMWSKDSGK